MLLHEIQKMLRANSLAIRVRRVRRDELGFEHAEQQRYRGP